MHVKVPPVSVASTLGAERDGEARGCNANVLSCLSSRRRLQRTKTGDTGERERATGGTETQEESK